MPLRSWQKDLPHDISLNIQLRKMLDDARWAGVNSKTPVLFDGEWTEWGDLAGNEKMECEFDDKGQLIGGFVL